MAQSDAWNAGEDLLKKMRVGRCKGLAAGVQRRVGGGFGRWHVSRAAQTRDSERQSGVVRKSV